LLHSLPGRCLPLQPSQLRRGNEDNLLARAIADTNKIEPHSIQALDSDPDEYLFAIHPPQNQPLDRQHTRA
jgi:hypothetical protein